MSTGKGRSPSVFRSKFYLFFLSVYTIVATSGPHNRKQFYKLTGVYRNIIIIIILIVDRMSLRLEYIRTPDPNPSGCVRCNNICLGARRSASTRKHGHGCHFVLPFYSRSRSRSTRKHGHGCHLVIFFINLPSEFELVRAGELPSKQEVPN
jgi:hypothetical protein